MVELTEGELKGFHLTYEQLDYQNSRTRLLLKTLLNHAGGITGFYKHTQKLLVEVYPAPQKGCVIYFTKLESRGKRYRQKHPQVFSFDSCEQLLQGAELLGQNPPPSEAYRLQERYILILQDTPLHGLREFGTPLPATRHLLAQIREHGQLLARPHAVEQLRGLPPVT